MMFMSCGNGSFRPGLPVTVMVSPSRGTVTGPGMAYLRESFHDPGVLPPGTGDNR